MQQSNNQRPLGEVIKDLILSSEILPNYKNRNYGKGE